MRGLAALCFLLLTAGPAWAIPPQIAFMDLIDGPSTGNPDTSQGQTANVNGTIVTLWGTNLGTSQGTSTITVGGVTPSAIYYWGNATPPNCGPANLHNGYMNLQCVIFQIASTTPVGANNVVVTVGGVATPPATFSVRPGRIILACASGCDFSSIQAALNDIDANSPSGGDILYVKNGMSNTAGVVLPHLKTNLVALVAFPGATVQLGQSDTQGLQAVASLSDQGKNYSKLTVYDGLGGSDSGIVMILYSNQRGVGNLLQAPLVFNSSTGCAMMTSGSNISLLGNEITQCNATASSFNNLYHVVYISGTRNGSGTLESDRYVRWNYIHDNGAARAINNFNANTSGDDPISGLRAENNVIITQSYSGIALLGGTVGENWVTNNLIISAGLAGPDGDVAGNMVCIEINGSWPVGVTPTMDSTYHIWGNTCVNSGPLSGGASRGVFHFNTTSVTWLDLHSNLLYETNGYPYLSVASSGATPSTDATKYSNNLWFGSGAAPAWDTSPVNADPLFVGGTNYRLQAASPARGAGSTINYATVDLDGIPRPTTTPWAIGAYQSTGVTGAALSGAARLTGAGSLR